jgi:hypothetical protein
LQSAGDDRHGRSPTATNVSVTMMMIIITGITITMTAITGIRVILTAGSEALRPLPSVFRTVQNLPRYKTGTKRPYDHWNH